MKECDGKLSLFGIEQAQTDNSKSKPATKPEACNTCSHCHRSRYTWDDGTFDYVCEIDKCTVREYHIRAYSIKRAGYKRRGCMDNARNSVTDVIAWRYCNVTFCNVRTKRTDARRSKTD